MSFQSMVKACLDKASVKACLMSLNIPDQHALFGFFSMPAITMVRAQPMTMVNGHGQSMPNDHALP